MAVCLLDGLEADRIRLYSSSPGTFEAPLAIEAIEEGLASIDRGEGRRAG